MMATKIILKKMAITNFKGIEDTASGGGVTIDFHESGTSIYGRNFSGKTSIYDAFCWALFDKDSSDNKNFDIKPLTADNQVKYPGADTIVTVTLNIDGTDTEFRKTYHEVWSQQRGSSDKVFSGHTSEYYIDDVPMKKTDYDRYIKDLIDETKFKTLTNVYMFCDVMNWQERRKVLFDMCNITDDMSLMATATDNQFDSLLPLMGKHTIDTLKSSVTEKRKSYAAEKTKIPIQISAHMETKTDALKIDYNGITNSDELEANKVFLEESINSLTTKIVEIKNDTAISKLNNELTALKNESIALENENNTYRNSQNHIDTSYITAKTTLQTQLSELKYELNDTSNRIKHEEQTAERLNKERDRIREEYNKPVNEKEEYCPTCNRLLDIGDLEKIRSNRTKYLAELRGRGLQLKSECEEIANRIRSFNDDEIAIEKQISVIANKIYELKEPEKPTVCDMPDYNVKKESLQSKQDDVSAQIRELQAESSAVLSKFQSELTKTNAELRAVNEQLSKRSVADDMDDKIEKLQAKERAIAAEIEQIDKTISLCDEFTKYKVSHVEESINSRFNIIKFKLFEEQINGGIKDCCEVLYKGVPFGTNASRSEQINAALDVIQTLSDFYNVRVPLFIDNAECVTELYNIDTQVIRLVVSENDKELRSEIYVAEAEKENEIDNTAA